MDPTLERLFCALFLGHMIGDYPLQNNWMACNKIKNDLEGWVAAISHCTVYTLAVTLMLKWFGFQLGPLIYLMVFLTHLPIDKVSFAKKWMKWYGNSTDMAHNPFAPLVYVAIDNTMHMVLMMVLLALIYGAY